MTKARARSNENEPRRLPRGRHALAPEQVREDQRRRLIEAVPRVVASRGYEAMSVADIVKAAGVSRNAFYENFGDKQQCFAAAHEACQERLLAILEKPCKRGATVEERVETSLGAGLDWLAGEPEVARLLFVEAPAATEAIALAYHGWLRRYGGLLRASFPPDPAAPALSSGLDEVIVGGIASRIAGEVLHGRAAQLRLLTPHFLEYALAFQPRALPGAEPAAAAPPAPSAEAPARPRRQAGA